MQCPLPRRGRDGGCAERMANGDNEAGDAMTTRGGTGHTTFTAFLLGLRSLRQRPGLAVAFLLATLRQGTLQGGMVWALRQVLIMLNGPGGVNRRVLLVGALAVCAVWLVRSAGVYAAQVLAGRLASRVELEWMRRGAGKSLEPLGGFFFKKRRGGLVVAPLQQTKTRRLRPGPFRPLGHSPSHTARAGGP